MAQYTEFPEVITVENRPAYAIAHDNGEMAGWVGRGYLGEALAIRQGFEGRYFVSNRFHGQGLEAQDQAVAFLMGCEPQETVETMAARVAAQREAAKAVDAYLETLAVDALVAASQDDDMKAEAEDEAQAELEAEEAQGFYQADDIVPGFTFRLPHSYAIRMVQSVHGGKFVVMANEPNGLTFIEGTLSSLVASLNRGEVVACLPTTVATIWAEPNLSDHVLVLKEGRGRRLRMGFSSWKQALAYQPQFIQSLASAPGGLGY